MKSVLVKSVLTATFLVGGLLAAPAMAQSQTYVRVQQEAPVFAGPGYEYPLVDVAQWNQTLRLHGCLRQIAWCDVSYGYARGWVDADNLYVYRGNQPYSFYQSRSWFVYPTISFTFGNYWNNHYRNTSWYSHRSRYSNWDWNTHSRHWGHHDGRYDRDRDDWRRRYGDHNRYTHDRNRHGYHDPRSTDPRRPDWRTHDGHTQTRPVYTRPPTGSTTPQPVINRPASTFEPPNGRFEGSLRPLNGVDRPVRPATQQTYDPQPNVQGTQEATGAPITDRPRRANRVRVNEIEATVEQTPQQIE